MIAGRGAGPGAPRRKALAALLAGFALLGSAEAVHAAAQEAAAVVTIGAITPTSLVAPAPTATLTLSGTVKNSSSSPIYRAQVVFWRSADPIKTTSALDSALALGPTSPGGARLATAPGEFLNLFGPDAALAPGQTVAFTVSTTFARLGFTTLDAAYLVGVQVRGSATANGVDSTLGRARTLLPVVSTAHASTHGSAALLTSRPSLLPTGVFRDDHLAEELSGRLRVLLTTASRPGATFLIDPSLFREVLAMSKPYQVLSGKTVVPGTGTPAAQAWLADFRALLAARPGYRLSFGNPDLVAAAGAPAGDAIPRWEAALAATPELASLPLAATLDSPPDQALLTFLAALKAKVVLTPGVPATPTITPAGVLIRTNPDAFAPAPAPATGGVQAPQRLLAEELLATDAPPVRLISTSAQAEAESSARADWAQAVPLQQIAAAAKATWTPPSDSARPAPVRGAELLTQLAAASKRLEVYTDLIGDKATARLDAAMTLGQALSRDWPDDAAALAFLTAALPKGSAGEGVVLRASPHFVMSSASNPFPVTVVNSLGVTVRVRVAFTSEQPLRIRVPSSELVTVAPGEAVTVNVRPEAFVNGLVNVTARLQTEGGTPIGRGVQIAIEATQFGLVGWIIVLTAGVVLIAATVLRIRQVQRERSRQESQ